MSVRIGLVESRSTLRQAVRFSLRGLSCELVEAIELSALELEDGDAAPLSLLILSSEYANSEPTALPDHRVPTISLGESGGVRPYLNLPFQSQALVELVCRQLGLEVPDAELYAPYREEIPIAADQKLSDSPADRPDEQQLSAEDSGQEGQTIEVAPIPDDGQEETVDFEESVRTDTMSEGEAQAQLQSSAKPAIVQPTGAAATSEAGVDDSLADEADFDDSDSFTNPVDVLPPLSDAVPDDEDVLGAGRPEPNPDPQARHAVPSVEKPDRSDAAKTPDPVEHAGSLADETTIGRDADVGEFDADTRQGLSEAQASEFAHNLERVLQDKSLAAKLSLPQDVVERVAWAVVPSLAERIIREEIAKLLRDSKSNG